MTEGAGVLLYFYAHLFIEFTIFWKMKIAVVIPAFNEEKSIPFVIGDLPKAM